MRRCTLALSLALSLTLPAATAWGYALMTNPPSSWRFDWDAGDEIPWVLNSAACPDMSFDETQGFLEASFQAWEDIDCAKIAFTYDGETNQVDTGNDNVNLMVWRMPGEEWPYGFGALGVTGTWFGWGTISDADIEFNSVHYTWDDTGRGGNIDLQSVATHEIGHFLGLDHSDVFSSVMFPTYSGGTGQRRLDPDDIAGAAFLYPVEGCEMCTTAAQCPQGFDCVGGDCVEGGGNLPVCAPCSNHQQCGGDDDNCVPYPVGGSFCGAGCERDEDCEAAPGCDGRSCACVETAEGSSQCVPESNSCEAAPECDDEHPCVGDYECVDGRCQPPACRALGGECDEREDCCSGMCLDGQCSQACDWLRPGESCPSGFYCEIQECGVGACKPGRLGGAGRGTVCESHEECSTGYCAATGGPTTCQTACDPDGLNTCPEDWTCTRIGASSCGLCACQLGRLGDPCTERGDCASGLCARREMCTRRCNDTSNPCPAGYDCLEAGDVSICWPNDGGFGADCSDDDDCTDGRCVDDHCTRDCDTDCDCPDRHVCAEVDGDRICRRGSSGGDGDGGCNCAAAGTAPPGPALLGALLVGLALRAARRRGA